MVSFFNDPASTGTESDYTFAGNPGYISDTGTRWIRLFLEWNYVQPVAGYAPGVNPPGWTPPFGSPYPAAYLAGIEAQISLANQNGVAVMLCTLGFPTWTNPVNAAAYGPGSPHDVSAGRSQTFCFPDVVSTTSPWGTWLLWLMQRYSVNVPGNPHFITVLEICNEPNYQCWPQNGTWGDTGAGDTGGAGCWIATLFAVAIQLLNSGNYGMFLAGPAMADWSQVSTPYYTNYIDFTYDILYYMAQGNTVAGPKFIWTHHNYDDFVYDRGSNSLKGSSQNEMHTSVVQTWLQAFGWAGWPTGAQGPATVWLSEGGARREQFFHVWPAPQGFNGIVPGPNGYSNSQLDSIQDQLVSRLWARCNNDAEGAGVAGFTNWGMYSYNPMLFDTGLLDMYQQGVQDRERPTYTFWKSLPGSL